ncbi:MAG: hypothetical protein K6F00_07300 [Lachnospiraceae bacterium]|nr:hypothetical protein [Lachnospiraceae bacterium]
MTDQNYHQNPETMDEERARMRSEEMRLRRLKKKRIQRKRVKRLLMAAFCLIIVLIAFAVVSLIGVFEKRSDENLLTLSENGKVVFEEVEDIKDSDLKKDELNKYIKEQIKYYNSKSGGKIKLERFSWGDEKVYVRTSYSSLQEYSDFTGYFIYHGDFKGAVTAEYDVTNGVKKVSKGKITNEDATSADMEGNNLLIIRENTAVKIPGEIVAVSSLGVELISEDTVRITSVNEEEETAVSTVIVYRGK